MGTVNKIERDAIILLGLNDTAVHEANALKGTGNKVLFIGKGSQADIIKSGGKTYDLSNNKGITAFIQTLKLNPGKESRLISVLQNSDNNIRDELAQLIIVLKKMEEKQSGPTRIVISGHSTDGTFWGDDNGMFEIEEIKKVTGVFPQASSIIEDLHLSACYSGYENSLKEWRVIFPKVKTIWGYSGSAPGAYTGATKHMTRWDSATRDIKLELSRSIAAKTRKGYNVAVWSERFGYQAQSSLSINDLVTRITRAESIYESYFKGHQIVTNTQSGPLRNYYNDLQALLGHDNTTPALTSRYRTRLATVLRLIYFDKSVKKKFSQHHSTLIDKVYKLLNMPNPNFSNLSRKDSLKAIENFEFTYNLSKGNNPPSEIGELHKILIGGLKDLKELYIPDNWI